MAVLPSDLLRVYVIDVDGQTVGFQALALDMPDFADDADEVIQTVEWSDRLPELREVRREQVAVVVTDRQSTQGL